MVPGDFAKKLIVNGTALGYSKEQLKEIFVVAAPIVFIDSHIADSVKAHKHFNVYYKMFKDKGYI